MSIESYTKIDTFKGVEKRKFGLEQIFAELKFNKKKAKYNYHSGLVAGMLINDLTIIKPIIESSDKTDNDLLQKMLERIIPKSEGLVKDYNWKMYDLNQLAFQFFGEEETDHEA